MTLTEYAPWVTRRIYGAEYVVVADLLATNDAKYPITVNSEGLFTALSEVPEDWESEPNTEPVANGATLAECVASTCQYHMDAYL